MTEEETTTTTIASLEESKVEDTSTIPQVDSFESFMGEIDEKIEQDIQKARDKVLSLKSPEERLEEIQDDLVIVLKQLKGYHEQNLFLRALDTKEGGQHDLSDTIKYTNESIERVCVQFSDFHENNLKEIQGLTKDQRKVIPKQFHWMFHDPEDVLDKIKKIGRSAILEDIDTISNTDLIASKTRLVMQREDDNVLRMLKILRRRLKRSQQRVKKIKIISPTSEDLTSIEKQRIIDISGLLYYYYLLSNEDVTEDTSLSELFPEISKARAKQIDRAAKKEQKKANKKAKSKK